MVEYTINCGIIFLGYFFVYSYILYYIDSIGIQVNSRVLQKMSRGLGLSTIEGENVKYVQPKWESPIGLFFFGIATCLWCVFVYFQKIKVEKLYLKTQCEWNSQF